MNIRELINFLIQITQKKYNLMNEIYEISKMQKIELENNNVDLLLRHVEEKQEKIEEVNELDKKFYSIYIKLKEELGIIDIENIDTKKYPEIKELKNQVGNILDVIKKIDELDKINNNKVKEELDKVKEELNKVRNNKKNLKNGARAYKGYNSRYNHAQGVFVDYKK
ncbi:flagellar export chaperone FlgN [Tepidibacter thalassicus]|uniref:FlgN protein n=1 Tax=Tepidibacter thalassicus DSM 15285 TaxID=1123350 RepID=A0A1M5R4N4_9FIRM|nr:flagellar export chaperone FlgN [Tepidibacter thalassicus]SHH20939.1 FlgN protein [Tepidibacter thalassicus DSM 15285]